MMQMGGQGGPSTLGKLFEKWGISFDTAKCVADDKAAVQMRGRNGAVVTDATVLELGKANIAKDVLTAGISQLIIPYAGALEFTPSEGLEFTPILTSSTNNACLVDASMLQMGPEAIRGQIKPDGVRRTLAGRLTGTFKTAFPKGPDWKEGSTNAVPTVVESGTGFVFLFADSTGFAEYCPDWSAKYMMVTPRPFSSSCSLPPMKRSASAPVLLERYGA